MTPPSANIVQHLDRAAEARPQAAALKVPRGRTRAGDIDYLTLSFAELRAEVAAWRVRLEAAGGSAWLPTPRPANLRLNNR